jgi:uncharacterized coiled-coil protein SlyX
MENSTHKTNTVAVLRSAQISIEETLEELNIATAYGKRLTKKQEKILRGHMSKLQAMQDSVDEIINDLFNQ